MSEADEITFSLDKVAVWRFIFIGGCIAAIIVNIIDEWAVSEIS
jgi:hypothetical protein